MTGTLIGLGGKLRAGKDAAGDYLIAHHDFVKLGMSDALNLALLKLNPIISYEIENSRIEQENGKLFYRADVHMERYQELHERVGYVEAKKNPEVRRLLQVLGTEVGREMIDPNVWVTIAERKIKSLLDNGNNVILTAVRFPNEVEMIERLGGTTVWIERPTEDCTDAESTITDHASENSVTPDMFDYTLVNDQDLQALYNMTEYVYRKIVSPVS